MITTLIIIVFVLGYLGIAFEHPLDLNKAASALITGVLCWTIYILHSDSPHAVNEELMHNLGEIGSILFFLLGAMTIVELIDLHNGFEIVTDQIKTNRKSTLLIIISIITFFLSAILDNLTTAIVMTSLCAKLLTNKEDRMLFAGMIVIAANAGGAWSPLGDVTTTMLWIGGQITPLNIIKQTILPSIAVCAIPLLLLSRKFGAEIFEFSPKNEVSSHSKNESKIVLLSGVGFLLFVPIFKTLTHLPPVMAMMLSLGCMWVITTIVHKGKEPDHAERYTVGDALERVDTSSILFFLGILLAVAALQSFGLLKELATFLSMTLKNDYIIGTALGLLSAVVDNVPLVAACQGMYDLADYPPDHPFWEFLALTTGTGGSIIIIGSAAGVAVMGIEKIDFMWYLKKISLLALIGFASGILVFLLQHRVLF